jgi:hypothetical protein
MAAIASDPTLKPGARLLLLFAGDLVSDDHNLLDVGCDWLGIELGTPRATVQRWRSELVDAGYLIPERLNLKGGRESNTYRLSFPTAHLRAVDNRSSTGGSRSLVGGQPLTNRSQTAHKPPAGGREPEPEPKPITPRPLNVTDAEALAAAVEEAKRDPEVRSAKAVGASRFKDDPERYRDLVRSTRARRQLEECSSCDHRGFLLDDAGLPIEPIERCSHGHSQRQAAS